MEEKNKKLAIEFMKRLTVAPGRGNKEESQRVTLGPQKLEPVTCTCLLSRGTISALFILLDLLIPSEKKRDFFEKLVFLRNGMSMQLFLWWDGKQVMEVSEFEQEVALENGLLKFSFFLGAGLPVCIETTQIEELIQSL